MQASKDKKQVDAPKDHSSEFAKKEARFAPGFYSMKRELRFDDLPVKGTFPDWLSGSFIRTGPGLYELKHQHYKHWFDGLALVRKFHIEGNAVSYANRFLKSRSYQEATKDGKVSIKEFATNPSRNFLQKALSYVKPPTPTDNGNINIIHYGAEYMAAPETPLPVIFDPETLETLGHFHFEDDLSGQIEPAHPHFDLKGGVYNYLLKFGLQSRYYVFHLPGGSKKRKLIAEIKASNPSYMHSMGMSENYIILTEFPKTLNALEMAFTDKPLIEYFHWRPALGTKYRVVHKKTGEVRTYEGDPLFAFHHVNSFEKDDKLFVDFVAFDDASVLDTLYLDELRSNRPTHAAGYLTRATIDLRNKKPVTIHRLSDKLFEFPRIYYSACNTKAYRYVYGAGNSEPGNFLDDITKIDVQTGTHRVWYQEHCYPGEPVFVPRPGAKEEDDGILLSVVLDTDAKNTFLLALNTQSMEEVARATMPEVVPFGFHGRFLGK